MKKRMLRNLEVSEIGMGCMGFSHGYGAVPDEDYAVHIIVFLMSIPDYVDLYGTS